MRTRPNYAVPLILSGLVGGVGTFLFGLKWSFLLGALIAPVGGSLSCLATAVYLFSGKTSRDRRSQSNAGVAKVNPGLFDDSSPDGRRSGVGRR